MGQDPTRAIDTRNSDDGDEERSDWWTEKYLKTNASAVARRLRAIHEVIAAAEDLALTEADQAKIPAQLGELAVKLPPMM